MYILKIVLIIWQSPSWFMKCMAVNVWYYIKEIKIILHSWWFAQLLTTSSTDSPEGEETSITVY